MDLFDFLGLITYHLARPPILTMSKYMSSETYDLLFKFIVIGDASVGKSCILHRFIDDKCTFRVYGSDGVL